MKSVFDENFSDPGLVFSLNKPQNYAPVAGSPLNALVGILSVDGKCPRYCEPSPCSDLDVNPETGEKECFASVFACECYDTMKNGGKFENARCDPGAYCLTPDGKPCEDCCGPGEGMSQCMRDWRIFREQNPLAFGDFKPGKRCGLNPPLLEPYDEYDQYVQYEDQSEVMVGALDYGEYVDSPRASCCDPCGETTKNASDNKICCSEDELRDLEVPPCYANVPSYPPDGSNTPSYENYELRPHPTKKCPDGTPATFCFCSGQIAWHYKCEIQGGRAECVKTFQYTPYGTTFENEEDCLRALNHPDLYDPQEICGIRWQCNPPQDCKPTMDPVNTELGVYLKYEDCSQASYQARWRLPDHNVVCEYNIKCDENYHACISTLEPVNEAAGIFPSNKTYECETYCSTGWSCHDINAGNDVECTQRYSNAHYVGPNAESNCKAALAQGVCRGVEYECIVDHETGSKSCKATTLESMFGIRFDTKSECESYCEGMWSCEEGFYDRKGCHASAVDKRWSNLDRYPSKEECEQRQYESDPAGCKPPTRFECKESGLCEPAASNSDTSKPISIDICQYSCGKWDCKYNSGSNKYECSKDPAGPYLSLKACEDEGCGFYRCDNGVCRSVDNRVEAGIFDTEERCKRYCGKWWCDDSDKKNPTCRQFFNAADPTGDLNGIWFSDSNSCDDVCGWFVCKTGQADSKNFTYDCHLSKKSDDGAKKGYAACVAEGCACRNEQGLIPQNTFYCEPSKKCIDCDQNQKSIKLVRDINGKWVDCECVTCDDPSKVKVSSAAWSGSENNNEGWSFCCDPCPAVYFQCGDDYKAFPKGVFDEMANPCSCCLKSEFSCTTPPEDWESGRCLGTSEGGCGASADGKYAMSEGCTGYRPCYSSLSDGRCGCETEVERIVDGTRITEKTGNVECTLPSGRKRCVFCDPRWVPNGVMPPAQDIRKLTEDCTCHCINTPKNCPCGIDRKTCLCKDPFPTEDCTQNYNPVPGVCRRQKRICPPGATLTGFLNLNSKNCKCKCPDGSETLADNPCPGFEGAPIGLMESGASGPFIPNAVKAASWGESFGKCGPNAWMAEDGQCYCTMETAVLGDGECVCADGYAVGADGFTCMDATELNAIMPSKVDPCENIICPPGKCCKEHVFGFRCVPCDQS